MTRGLIAFSGAFLSALLCLAPWSQALADPCVGALAAPRDGRSELTITYYGVSTLMISDGTERLLIDGFFSRPNLASTIMAPIGSKSADVAKGLGKAQPPVVGVLTAHAHHDHALDSAAIAVVEKKAIILGTPSVGVLAKAQGAPAERVCVARQGVPVQLGAYTVTPFYTLHGPSSFFLRWLLDHDLKEPPSGRARFSRFKDDKNLSFLIKYGKRSILVHPSAGQSDLGEHGAETVFLGIGRLGRMRGEKPGLYLQGAAGDQARTIVPVHWDGLTTPLLEPLRPSPWLLDDVGKGLASVCQFATPRGMDVIQLEAGAQIVLWPDGRVTTSLGASDPCLTVG